MWRPRDDYRAPRLAFNVATGALGVLSAWLVVQWGPFLPRLVIVALPVAIVAVIVIAKYGPVVFLGGIVALPMAGLNPVIMTFGGAEIRASDVLFPVVLLSVLAVGRGRGLSRQITRPLGVLCVAVIASAIVVSRSDLAVLSALRFVATMSLALLIVALCRSRDDVIFLLRTTGLAIVIGLGLAIIVGSLTSALSERFGQGLLGPNILGLVSAFLVLLASTRAVYQRGSTRLLLALSGIAGLILAKSVGSAVALIIALAVLYGLRNRAVRAGRAVVAFTVLFGLAIVFVAAFRPTSLPWNEEFSVNSGQQRLIEAYAGLHVFLQQPLIGVGWGQSGEAIGSPAVGSTVRQLFASANPLLYPDVQAASVHNAYIQILAELGLIGGLLILWLIRNSFLASRAIVRFGHSLAPFLACSLMLFAVWWNETAFFGGQSETFLFAVVLGSLAVARSELGGKLWPRATAQGTKESRLIARAPS